MRKRAEGRNKIKPRYWHVVLCAVAGSGIFGVADAVYFNIYKGLPGLKDIWWVTAAVPLICGAAVTLGCAGAQLSKRIIASAFCGAVTGILYTAISATACSSGQIQFVDVAVDLAWRMFVFTVLSVSGAIVTELKLP